MVNLVSLALLRNDSAVADELLQAARQGDVDAQVCMGLIYAEGRGVEQDEAGSFYWLTRAIEQSDNGAAVLRKLVATGMTTEQLARAKLLLQADLLVQNQARGHRRRKRKRKHKHKQRQPGLH